jgi:hypothetical protein
MEFLKFLCIYGKKRTGRRSSAWWQQYRRYHANMPTNKNVIAFITEVKYFMYEETFCKRKDTELHYNDFYG